MNLLVLFETGELGLVGLDAYFFPCCNGIQGFYMLHFIDLKLWHLIVAAIWTLHNDVIDYVFFMLPSYSVIDQYHTANWLFYILVKCIFIIDCLLFYVYEEDRLSIKVLEDNNWSNLVHHLIHC